MNGTLSPAWMWVCNWVTLGGTEVEIKIMNDCPLLWAPGPASGVGEPGVSLDGHPILLDTVFCS